MVGRHVHQRTPGMDGRDGGTLVEGQGAAVRGDAANRVGPGPGTAGRVRKLAECWKAISDQRRRGVNGIQRHVRWSLRDLDADHARAYG